MIASRLPALVETSLRPAVWVVKPSRRAAIPTPEDQVHVEIVGDPGLDLVEQLPEVDEPMLGIEGGMGETGGAHVSLVWWYMFKLDTYRTTLLRKSWFPSRTSEMG